MAAKKGVKKKTAKSSSKKPRVEIHNVEKEDGAQKILIENFIGLQRVLADLSEKINNLTNQTSKLLDLFEDSAKALMEKDGKIPGIGDKEVSDKLNKLLDQNKILAQGVSLLHESNSQNMPPQDQQFQNQAPPFQRPPQEHSVNRYQKSISSKY